MARQPGISRRSLRRKVNEDLGLHPYPVTILPKLSNVQKRARITFVNWVRQSLTKDSIGKILFSDLKNILLSMEYLIDKMIECTPLVELQLIKVTEFM